ncbi:MAG: peptidoglycan DD-metalloendopeptidase family protein [candidate division FCPU426 bacterium]
MKKAALLFFALALGGRLLAEGATPDLGSKREQLERIEDEKKRIQDSLKGLEKNEHSVLKQLESLDRSLNTKRLDLNKNQKRMSQVEKRLAELKRKTADHEASLANNRVLLRGELKAIYTSSASAKGAALLLSSASPAEMISRARYLRVLAGRNAAHLKKVQRSLALVQVTRRESEQRRVDLVRHQAQVEKARLEVAAQKAKREARLDEVRQKKSQTQALLKETERAAAKLEDMIQGFQSRPTQPVRERRSTGRAKPVVVDSSPSKLGRRGSLPWPVKGRVVSRFGKQNHPLFRTVIFNRGVEIAAPLGAAVKAVADGTVKVADELGGYGKTVILDHGDGAFTVYGHNSDLAVKPDQKVVRGQVIAQVGDSSVLKSPSLYFEISIRAKAVNPLEWFSR